MMTLQQIAAESGAKLRGDPAIRIQGIETVSGARPGDLTFASDTRHLDSLMACPAAAAFVTPELAGRIPDDSPLALLICEDCQSAFATVARKFRQPPPRPDIGVSPAAFVSDTAEIGDGVNIFPGAYVGERVTIGPRTTVFPGVTILAGASIGCDVTIFPNAVLYEETVVGDRCVIHAGAVLGAWGFGYQSDADGHQLSEQLGHVQLGEDVEIGACATIDRGTWGATRVGTGSKLDNQVMIGHNSQIGDHNLLCSQVGIAGSSTGAFVVMAGQVGIADHISIGDYAILGAKSGVMHQLPGHQTYLGAPAKPARDEMQLLTALAKLPAMRRDFKRVSKRVDQLSEQLTDHDKTPAIGFEQRDAA